ncbi:hypothetical protein LINPERPRIM_LOCUS36768 [Linum perenne]
MELSESARPGDKANSDWVMGTDSYYITIRFDTASHLRTKQCGELEKELIKYIFIYHLHHF